MWSNGQDTGLRSLGSGFDSLHGYSPGRGAAWQSAAFGTLGEFDSPPPHPRSAAESAPESESGGRWFEPSRGYATITIHCGQTQAGDGCPAAPHKGGVPGSTPGPVTVPPVRSHVGYFLGRRDPPTPAPDDLGGTLTRNTSRCEGARLLRLARWVQVPRAAADSDLGKPNDNTTCTSPVRRRAVLRSARTSP